MTKKSFALFFVSLVCDVLVYWNKIAPLNLGYVDNIIKIYFVYVCIITVIYLFSAIILCVITNSSRLSIEDTSSKKIADVIKLTKHSAIKPMMVFCFIVDFGFGIIGCWWFFSVLMVKQISFVSCMMFCRQIIEKIRKKNPEMIQNLETSKTKKDSKMKFKFVRKS